MIAAVSMTSIRRGARRTGASRRRVAPTARPSPVDVSAQ